MIYGLDDDNCNIRRSNQGRLQDFTQGGGQDF